MIQQSGTAFEIQKQRILRYSIVIIRCMRPMAIVEHQILNFFCDTYS